MDEYTSENSEPSEVTDSDILEVLESAEFPILKTSEIADELEISSRQVRNRLESLEENERIGSRMVTAKNRAKLWWHGNIGVARRWPSDSDQQSMIGVEPIDSVSLPGRGETLRARREAVSSVFKYLFDEKAGEASQLKFVGWGADPETYASPQSLWNNCLKKALDRSTLFRLLKSEKVWELNEIAVWLRDQDTRSLWNDWEIHKRGLNKEFHNRIHSILAGDENQKMRYSADSNLSQIAINISHSKVKIIIQIQTNGEIWSGIDGTISCFLRLNSHSVDLEELLNQQSEVESNLSFTVDWVYYEDEGYVDIYRSKSIELDHNEPFGDLSEFAKSESIATAHGPVTNMHLTSNLSDVKSWAVSTVVEFKKLKQILTRRDLDI